MSWYDEKRDGPDKRYIEWAFGDELVPDEEPGFYRANTDIYLCSDCGATVPGDEHEFFQGRCGDCCLGRESGAVEG